MSKQLKTGGKKTFVRNTEQKIPKVTIKTQQSVSKFSSKTQPNKTVENQDENCVKFDEPKPNSSKKITEKIEMVKSTKSIKIDQNKDGLIEEKITKKMNFPTDQAVYKDLMPLCVKMKSTRIARVRDPLPPKDVEPNLSDFYQCEKLPEYVFRVEPEPVDPQKLDFAPYDGHNVTKHMKTWDNIQILKTVD